MKGLSPASLAWLASAPLSSSRSTTASLPHWHAMYSGEKPPLRLASTFAFASMSSRTTS